MLISTAICMLNFNLNLGLLVAHWLMIGGALFMFVGLVGAVLQRRRAAAHPSSSEQGKVTDTQQVSLPDFLEKGGSRAVAVSRGDEPAPI